MMLKRHLENLIKITEMRLRLVEPHGVRGLKFPRMSCHRLSQLDASRAPKPT